MCFLDKNQEQTNSQYAKGLAAGQLVVLALHMKWPYIMSTLFSYTDKTDSAPGWSHISTHAAFTPGEASSQKSFDIWWYVIHMVKSF